PEGEAEGEKPLRCVICGEERGGEPIGPKSREGREGMWVLRAAEGVERGRGDVRLVSASGFSLHFVVSTASFCSSFFSSFLSSMTLGSCTGDAFACGKAGAE